MKAVDQNGNVLYERVRKVRHDDGRIGWRKTMWFGGVRGCATTVTTKVFATRKEARRAWIDDWPCYRILGDYGPEWTETD